MHINYNTVDKRIKPVAVQLTPETREILKKPKGEPSLREPYEIGHKYTEETIKKLHIGGDGFLIKVEKKAFKEMIAKHVKTFSFSIDVIGCVDLREVTPMVI